MELRHVPHVRLGGTLFNGFLNRRLYRGRRLYHGRGDGECGLTPDSGDVGDDFVLPSARSLETAELGEGG